LTPRSLVLTMCVGRFLITSTALPRRCPKAGQATAEVDIEKHEIIAVCGVKSSYKIPPQILQGVPESLAKPSIAKKP
jgi:hypothetical protein